MKIKKDLLNYSDLSELLSSNRNEDYFGGVSMSTQEVFDYLKNNFKSEFGNGNIDFSVGNIEKVMQWMAKWLTQDDSLKGGESALRKGIMLVGEPGVGKTALMEAMLKLLRENNKTNFGRYDKGRVINGIYDNRYYCYTNAKCPTAVKYDFYNLRSALLANNNEQYIKCKDGIFSFIDDIGYASTSGDVSIFGNKVNFIEEILTYRYNNNYFTFATSNTTNISEHPAVSDRIGSMFNVIKVNGISRMNRQKKLDEIEL